MEVQIKATNLKLTDSIKNYVDKRLQTLDKLIDPDDTSVLCVVEVERTAEHNKGDVYRSEINLHIAGQDFRADATREKLYEAIDETKNQMNKELRRHKKKRQKERRKGGATIKNLVRGFRGD